ncbi:hypothetical protein [Deinococcus planocerae]|uniref:hypothetical protein n=1 Tax=Deinococcus planocerae TaxID=1737569 RepID=UPI000C7F2DA5|nr:hypothetical protein [Deinococcus planocerae]
MPNNDAGGMRRAFMLCLTLGLVTTGGQARTPPEPRTALELQQLEPTLAGQPVKMRLLIYRWGNGAQVVGGLRDDHIPCPLFKVYDKAGGPPIIERYLTANCDVGKNVTFKTGEQRVYAVTLPMKLAPGAYTAILTLRSQPPMYARTIVNIGPGPFVAELVLPSGAKAGKPLDLRVAFRNVWRSTASRDLRLCGQGLLIRDAEGQTVYDNRPEKTACTSDLRPTTVAPGGVHIEPWGPLPALKAGRYTAVLWGEGAVKRFEVRP